MQGRVSTWSITLALDGLFVDGLGLLEPAEGADLRH
jgi:hypothetical protein